jgi:SET domain-containing protein
MILVKTKIGPSKVHGIGLFADQFIPKGTVTFEYTPSFDVSFTKEEIEKMPKITQDYLIFYTYFDKKRNKYVLCSDNQRFINHTDDINKMNIKSTPDQDVAMRDIQPGEEFLCNYNDFDDTYFDRMGYTKEKLN